MHSNITILFCHQFQDPSTPIPLDVVDCNERLHNNNLCYHSYFFCLFEYEDILFSSIENTWKWCCPFSKWYPTLLHCWKAHCSENGWYADTKCFDERFLFCPMPHVLFTEMLSIGNNRANMRIFDANKGSWHTSIWYKYLRNGKFSFQNPLDTVTDYRSLKVKLGKAFSPGIWSCIEHQASNIKWK